jgi:hypothetical protein
LAAAFHFFVLQKILICFSALLKRAPLHRAPLRPSKARKKHASDARFAKRQTSTNSYAFSCFEICWFQRKRQKIGTKHYSIVKNANI